MKILVCSKYIVLLWQHWFLPAMPLKQIWLWIWIWESMACGSGGLLYLASLHSNSREREACFNLSAESISLSLVIHFYSQFFCSTTAINSVAHIMLLKQFVIDKMRREKDRERLRANSTVSEPQWSGSKCVFFCLSLANTHKTPSVKREIETYLPTLYCATGQQA